MSPSMFISGREVPKWPVYDSVCVSEARGVARILRCECNCVCVRESRLHKPVRGRIGGVALARNSCRSFQNFVFFKNQMDKFVRNIFNIKMLDYYWSIIKGGRAA